MEKTKVMAVLYKLKSNWEVYSIVSKGPIAKEAFIEELKSNTKLKASSISEKSAAVYVDESNRLPLIKCEDGKAELDEFEVMDFLYTVMDCLGVTIKEEQKPVAKKPKPEDLVPKVMTASSPQFKKLQKENKALKAQLKLLQAKSQQDMATAILGSMEKVVNVEPMYSEPRQILERDCFLQNLARGLDVEYLMKQYHAEPAAIYCEVEDEDRELTVEKFGAKIRRILFRGKLLKNKYEEQEALARKATRKEKKKAEKNKAAKAKEAEEAKKQYENQLHAINELLADKSIPNQVKLAVYASYREPKGSEMEELLNFAGENAIDAEYVIRLLENPAGQQNYRMIRNFLRQAFKGSEARIKRETARELIAGEWYVVADYCGQPCQFRMLPVDELLMFKKQLEDRLYLEATDTLTSLLEKKRAATFKEGTAHSEIIVADTGHEEVKPVAKDNQITVPDFIKKEVEESGVDCHEPIDEDAVYEAYSESEVKTDGEE